MKKIMLFFVLLLSFSLFGCNEEEDLQNITLNGNPAELEIKFFDSRYDDLLLGEDAFIKSLSELEDYSTDEEFLNQMKAMYDEEFFQTKGIICIGFKTCSSEISSGKITVNRVICDSNPYQVIFDISSPLINTEDYIVLSYIIEVNLADCDLSESPIEIEVFVKNRLSGSRGSYHYPNWNSKKQSN